MSETTRQRPTPDGEWTPVTWLPEGGEQAAAPKPGTSGPSAPNTPRQGPGTQAPPAPGPGPHHGPTPPAPQGTTARPAPSRPAPEPGPENEQGEWTTGAPLDERSMVRERADRPGAGWRLGVLRATGGLVNPGPSPAEKAHLALLARVRRPLRGAHRIAVMSIKGGVGKTSVTACLGLMLAEHRGDRVVVLDANPDAGTLADRLTGETSVTVRDLIRNLDHVRSLTDVSGYTSLAGRLQVLASEQDPAAAEAFNRSEYERVSAVLTRFYNIAITDSGTGMVHSAMAGTLHLADTLVVVGSPTVDGASRAAKTLDWLRAHGFGEQVRRAIVVLSCDRTSREVDVAHIREYLGSRCRAVVDVPFDAHLATGGRIDPALLQRPTVHAFLQLASHVADGFGRDPLTAE